MIFLCPKVGYVSSLQSTPIHFTSSLVFKHESLGSRNVAWPWRNVGIWRSTGNRRNLGSQRLVKQLWNHHPRNWVLPQKISLKHEYLNIEYIVSNSEGQQKNCDPVVATIASQAFARKWQVDELLNLTAAFDKAHFVGMDGFTKSPSQHGWI